MENTLLTATVYRICVLKDVYKSTDIMLYFVAQIKSKDNRTKADRSVAVMTRCANVSFKSILLSYLKAF